MKAVFPREPAEPHSSAAAPQVAVLKHSFHHPKRRLPTSKHIWLLQVPEKAQTKSTINPSNKYFREAGMFVLFCNKKAGEAPALPCTLFRWFDIPLEQPQGEVKIPSLLTIESLSLGHSPPLTIRCEPSPRGWVLSVNVSLTHHSRTVLDSAFSFNKQSSFYPTHLQIQHEQNTTYVAMPAYVCNNL